MATPARLQRRADLGRQMHQRCGQDVGEHQVIGRVLSDARIAEAVREIEVAFGVVDLGVFVGDAGRRLVDVGADGDGRARLGRSNGQNAGAAADVQHLIEAFGLQQSVEGFQTADGRAVVAGPEGGARVDLQVHTAFRHLALVVRAIDEETPRLDRREAGQRHGQPVGVGQLFDHDLKPAVIAQDGGHAFGLFVRGGEAVDAPDFLVLVFLEDGIGCAFKQDVGVNRFGCAFSRVSRAARDYLNCRLGHFSNTANMTNRCDLVRLAPVAAAFLIKPRGRGIHGQITNYV